MMPLFDQIASVPSLRRGWIRVEANDGTGGADGVSIYQFGLRLEAELAALADELQRGTYRAGPLLANAFCTPSRPRSCKASRIRLRA